MSGVVHVAGLRGQSAWRSGETLISKHSPVLGRSGWSGRAGEVVDGGGGLARPGRADPIPDQWEAGRAQGEPADPPFDRRVGQQPVIDQIHRPDTVGDVVDGPRQSHGLGGVGPGPDKVDDAALAAWPGCAFDDDDVPPQGARPVGQGQTGDTGSANRALPSDSPRPLGHDPAAVALCKASLWDRGAVLGSVTCWYTGGQV